MPSPAPSAHHHFGTKRRLKPIPGRRNRTLPEFSGASDNLDFLSGPLPTPGPSESPDHLQCFLNEDLRSLFTSSRHIPCK